MLDISALSIVIVIITICDMPRKEFSLRDRVYIHNTIRTVYVKQKVVP